MPTKSFNEQTPIKQLMTLITIVGAVVGLLGGVLTYAANKKIDEKIDEKLNPLEAAVKDILKAACYNSRTVNGVALEDITDRIDRAAEMVRLLDKKKKANGALWDGVLEHQLAS